MKQIQFGTDGWRDIIADGFDFESVSRVAQAHAQFIQQSGGSRVVIGFDTRFASDRFARRVAEVMAANGLATHLSTSYIPTPALSFAVVQFKADNGVMITASHNPPSYNGYKIKGAYGGSATPATAKAVEAELERLKPIPDFDPAIHQIQPFDIRKAYTQDLLGARGSQRHGRCRLWLARGNPPSGRHKHQSGFVSQRTTPIVLRG
jgi:phosphomannomutase